MGTTGTTPTTRTGGGGIIRLVVLTPIRGVMRGRVNRRVHDVVVFQIILNALDLGGGTTLLRVQSAGTTGTDAILVGVHSVMRIVIGDASDRGRLRHHAIARILILTVVARGVLILARTATPT